MPQKGLKSARVFEYIRSKIKAGLWSVDTKIPSERTLTSQLKVSRSTLRSVINEYISLGILKSHQGSGTFVVSDAVSKLTGILSDNLHERSHSQVKDLLEFRLLVEVECIKKVLSRPVEELGPLICELEKCNALMEENVGRPESFIAADIAFHILIAEASGNRFVGECLHMMFERTLSQHRQINDLFGFQDGLRCHKKILKAIKTGSAVKAQREMRLHIQKALEALE